LYGPRPAHIQRMDGYEMWVAARGSGRDLALFHMTIVWHPEGSCFVIGDGEDFRQPIMFPPGSRMLGQDMDAAVFRLPGVSGRVRIGTEPLLVFQGGGGVHPLPRGFDADPSCWRTSVPGSVVVLHEIEVVPD
jgi:hypothetical protein